MKTLGHFSPMVAPLVVAVLLVLFSGEACAAGPGGGGVAAGGSHGAAAGSSGGGISGGANAGAGRGGGFSAPATSGMRAGVAFSNNGARFGGSGFARSATMRGSGVPSTSALSYRGAMNAGAAPAARSAVNPSVSRPANAWSGMAVSPSNNTAAARGTARSSYRNNWSDNGFTGHRLDPGAPGANLPSYNRGNYGNGNGYGGRYGHYRSRFGGGYYYYPYAYGPDYAPYISYFGGGYAGAYPYYNDIQAADTGYENSPAATVSPQYVEQAPANGDEQQPDATPQPAPQRQEQPGNANQGTIPKNGPDSLVEAVQEELVRRGYFGGKVDAMFNADTKEALRKFQTDHHLAATGLINEATLHALQLD